MIIDGKNIANEIIMSLKELPKPEKFLAAFLVGEDSASVSFLKQKEGVAKELGLDFRLYKPEHTKNCVLGRAHTLQCMCFGFQNDTLREFILKIVQHKTCGGAIVQLPLPEHINRQYVLNVIPREKDIDVLGERALGTFYAGRSKILPPAVGVVETILENCLPAESAMEEQAGKLKIENCRVAVIGLGSLVGKPIANWLMGKVKEIYLLDEGSDLTLLKEADLIISGVGKANLFNAGNLKENSLVIDFGYSFENGKISGDFNSSMLLSSSSLSYTPTPGGTGPILVAKLFENFYKLNAN